MSLVAFSLPIAVLGFIFSNKVENMAIVYTIVIMRLVTSLYLFAIFLVFMRLLAFFKRRKVEKYEMKRLSQFEFNIKKSAL